jgi:hypothetical protein
MKSFVGRSFELDASSAAEECTRGWPAEAPDLVLVFSSTKQDAGALRAALEARCPGALVIGCTTSGEQLSGRHANGSVSAAALYTPNVRWSAEVISPLSAFEDGLAAAAVERALAKLGALDSNVDPQELVGLLLCDGLSCKEEVVAAAVAEALDGIPLVGGSAGDDLAFQKTLVSAPGMTTADAAVILIGRGPAGFYRILKHQHFTSRPTTLAVTRADPTTRRVYELDGYPAADAYARALGIPRAELADATFLHPVLVTVQGRKYVRSVQSIAEDGSIAFYCAVGEGWILELAGHEDMTSTLRDDLARFEVAGDKPGFVIGFNCILRALEAQSLGAHDALGAIIESAADASIAFDTYGEVLDGLHINQTLVALALSRAA